MLPLSKVVTVLLAPSGVGVVLGSRLVVVVGVIRRSGPLTVVGHRPQLIMLPPIALVNISSIPKSRTLLTLRGFTHTYPTRKGRRKRKIKRGGKKKKEEME